jgi:predicted DCC family thiol-disulfide oxidoreductase YuxK
MALVTPTGHIYRGAEAIAHVLATRPFGRLAYIYYLPGLRLLCDATYALVAAARYRLRGRIIAEHGCDGGTCALHYPTPEKNPSHG